MCSFPVMRIFPISRNSSKKSAGVKIIKALRLKEGQEESNKAVEKTFKIC